MIERLRRFADTGNAVRFLLSFVLAFALWAWVTIDNDPEQTYSASQVPIATQNLTSSLELVGTLPSVNVRLQGPRSVIQRIDAGAVVVTIDLADITAPGVYERTVNVSVPEGIRKVRTDPPKVSIELGSVVTRTLPVELLAPDEVARNLTVTAMDVEPRQVTVTGVQQSVDQVARIVVPVQVADQIDSFTFEATPEVIDANGAVVSRVDVEPSRVTVRVTLEVRGKVIPVFVDYDRTTAEGYDVVGDPFATPNTVLIDGPRELLDEVTFMYTTQVRINDLTAPKVLTGVPLDTSMLPDGVTVEPELVDVSVRIEQTDAQMTFEGVEVEVLHAAEGDVVVVSPATIDVTITGPREDIAALTAADIAAVIDVEDLEAGSHQLRPLIVLPPRTRYTDPPPQVVVTISTPTRTPSPSPSPTVRPTSTATVTPTVTPTP